MKLYWRGLLSEGTEGAGPIEWGIGDHFWKPRKTTPMTLDLPFIKSPLLLRVDQLPEPRWLEKAEAALREKSLEKVVLARKTTLTFQNPIDAWGLASELEKRAIHATLFALEMAPDHVFLGATPEKLYVRQGRKIWADAIAGTRPRGTTVVEDNRLAKELMGSDKELREFQYVKERIEADLRPLCSSTCWGKEEILLQRFVQHRSNQFIGELNEDVTDETLIKALHPTPAISGWPKSAAINWLKTHEGWDRGHYATTIGYRSPEKAEFVIAIRSATVRGREIDLYAGVGLVEGSTPQHEWQELEHKIKPFLEILL